MKPVGIQAMAANCSLGSNLSQIGRNLLNLNPHSPLIKDTDYIFNNKTYLGHARFKNRSLDAAFDYRVNQLLFSVFKDLEATYQALAKKLKSHRIGVVLGTSTAGVDGFEKALHRFDKTKKWPRKYRIHEQRMASVSEFLADHLNLTGPCLSISTACSSSSKALITAKRWLNEDMCDLVIAGGVDVLCQLTVNGFDALGALSYERCLPFSANRNGINIGEGAALMLLTQDNTSLNILGGGESSDAYHISAPDPKAGGAIRAMNAALLDAELEAKEIDYINLHGTGTTQNDAMESLAVNQIFGTKTPCSSTKQLTGHTLGAAGAIEAVLSAISMTDINSQGVCIPHLYDGCYDPLMAPINLVSNNIKTTENRQQKTTRGPQIILSNSFAFGGSNASVIIGKHPCQPHP